MWPRFIIWSLGNEACFGKKDVISTADSRWKAIVMPTDEELMIARNTLALVK